MVFPILYCFSIAFALGQLHTITSINRDRKRNAVTYHDLSWALALGLGFQWISAEFCTGILLRSKPCSAWNRPNRPRFPASQILPGILVIILMIQHTISQMTTCVDFAGKKQVLLRKNHGAWWKLHEIAAPCSLFLFISAAINCWSQELFGSGNGNTLGTLSIL